ncbi:hypothetical protein ABPG74_002105 [Tetrahymena malaccensis]
MGILRLHLFFFDLSDQPLQCNQAIDGTWTSADDELPLKSYNTQCIHQNNNQIISLLADKTSESSPVASLFIEEDLYIGEDYKMNIGQTIIKISSVQIIYFTALSQGIKLECNSHILITHNEDSQSITTSHKAPFTERSNQQQQKLVGQQSQKIKQNTQQKAYVIFGRKICEYMRNYRHNCSKIQSLGQLNSMVQINDEIPQVSFNERKQQNLKFIAMAEQSTKQKDQKYQQQLLEYYNQHKDFKLKHIYKDVENAINQKKDYLLPKLQLEKINLIPPPQDLQTSPNKRRKRQYHYFAKNPISNSINLKDLSTRSSHFNNSQFTNDKLDQTATQKDQFFNQHSKKQLVLNELNKLTQGQMKINKKIQFIDNRINSINESALSSEDQNQQLLQSQQSFIQRQTTQETEDINSEAIRYNFTFRGSVQRINNTEDRSPNYKSKINSSFEKAEKEKVESSSSDSSSSDDSELLDQDDGENLDTVSQNRDSLQSNASIKSEQKLKMMSQRLSMQQFIKSQNALTKDSQIKVKLKKTDQINENKQVGQEYNNDTHQAQTIPKSIYYKTSIMENKVQQISQPSNNLQHSQHEGFSINNSVINRMLRRQASQAVKDHKEPAQQNNNGQIDDQYSIENEVSIDEYSKIKYRERLKSLTGKQLEEIQKMLDFKMKSPRKRLSVIQQEKIQVLNKKEQKVQKELKINHKKLYHIALKVKKSNQLDDEYKDISVFKRNLGYSLPIIHTLKYFDVNSGQYKYLQGRSSFNEEVQPEYNEYYHMLESDSNVDLNEEL